MGLQINQLTRVTPSAGQTVPVYDPNLGDARAWSVDELKDWLQANLDFSFNIPVTQYAAPSASPFSVSITDDDNDVHLILTPTAGFAAGTIVLPAVANLRDKQLVIVNCTQAVTALTIDGNGATAVTGEPSALLANGFFTMKYDGLTRTWYRVG